MAPTEATIIYINYSITVYVGYVIIITGLIGNIINILIFTQLKLFRKNQSALYLIVTAIVECLLLIIATLTRVITASNGYDLTKTSIVWCKLRAYLIQWGGVILPTTICFSAIDQYISTSYHVQLRQISTFKLAQRLISITVVLAGLYSIPVLIYQEIRSGNGCSTYNSSYNYFYSFVHLCIIIGLLPIVVSLLFSLLSFRNVRRIVRRQIPIIRRRLDRQLTAMILVRVALFVVTTLPLVSVRTYQFNHSIDPNNTYDFALDLLFRTVVTTLYNMNYSGSCYIFMATSVRFRRQVRYLFCKKLPQKLLIIQNAIAPADQQQGVEPHVSAIDVE